MATERDLEPPMRILLALLGAIALVAGVMVGAAQLRLPRGEVPALPTLLVVGMCALVVVGGALLLRGAVRGRITVRQPGRRPPIL